MTEVALIAARMGGSLVVARLDFRLLSVSSMRSVRLSPFATHRMGQTNQLKSRCKSNRVGTVVHIDSSGQFRKLKKSYAVTEVQRRIHQGAFQERVIRAYRHQCAFCTLGYRELLDAAHIIPDSELRGEPVVSNGMSLCRLHHAAFDRLFLGVHPD